MNRDDFGRDVLAPVEILEFSDDLRVPDVQPLQKFLVARLDELIDAAPEGSGAHFTAVRLKDLVRNDALHLADLLGEWEDVVEAGRTHQVGHVQRLRQDVGIWWNRLCATAAHFHGHPDYRPRWRELRFLCLEHAEIIEQVEGGFSRGVYEGGAHP
ncbi:hypothetical protein GCM10010218_38690 [Streptomyces mashuensis]|uniref:Uncharacterized protein n=1 Tax=Streptomyces mashuensis TaxID=33904 RepID=A0A919B5A3_9ACTN|nr:hypothetical protein [Streptomyces mashuensis]GHF53460.1 hypothetical protein GCM10010218_38690 [Streptomyces mashuensis]